MHRLAQAKPWLPLLMGAGIALLVLLIWSAVAQDQFERQFDSLVATDIDQARIDTALAVPQGELTYSQTFVPRHNGLSEVEITLVKYGEATAGEDGQISLQIFNNRDELVAGKSIPTSSVTHNQVMQVPVPAQDDSKGRRYSLRLSGSPGNTVSAWGYSLDAYGDGRLLQDGGQTDDAGTTAAQDLRFLTRYRLTWNDALNTLVESVYYEGLLFLLILLVLPLPGVLLMLAEHAYRVRQATGSADGRARSWDPAAWWGAAFALGVTAWPILWTWLTMVGARWTDWLLAIFIFAGWVAAVWYWWHEWRLRRRTDQLQDDAVARAPIVSPWRWDHLILLVIIALGFMVRLVAVRDTLFLPWVDASRHGLITAVMAQNGQTISDYSPYLPIDRFPYHYGFHVLSSSLQILSDWPLERLLLYLSQLLNALVPLTLFAAVWLMVRKRGAGYLAAFLVALPFFFPAYYTTWGRLTQLTAVLPLPVLLAFTWQLFRGGEAWIDRWWLLGILAAGLFLIHFRVFAYYLPFPLLVLLVSRFRRARWLIAAAILAFILALPHIFGLLADTNPVQQLNRTISDYNNFPTNYFTTGWEQTFIGVAAVTLLFPIVGAFRRQTWAVLPLVLVGWVASLFALLSLDRLGLAVPSLVNLNSMYITLFVPLAIYLAIVADQIWLWLVDQAWPVRFAGYALTGALLVLMLVYGVRRQVNILNLRTLLTQAEDLIAVRWLDENLPDDGLVAVNSWLWLGETWAVADGGSWILPLTGRQVTTPPIDHIYNPDLFLRVKEFNEVASAVSDWSDPEQAAWLREQDVTHVFVGKRGGFFDPAKLASNPNMEMIFDHDGVFIFAVNE